MDDDTPNGVEYEFVEWLKRNKLQSYQQALEELGYEELESVVLLNTEEVEALSSAIQMKAGHRKKFPVAIQNAREKMKREKAKQEREEELADELAQIERARTLAQAKARSKREQQQVDIDEKAKAETEINHDSTLATAKTESKHTDLPATTTTKSEEATRTKPENKAPDLPDGFKYHYFAS
jgi:hypothetical protein